MTRRIRRRAYAVIVRHRLLCAVFEATFMAPAETVGRRHRKWEL